MNYPLKCAFSCFLNKKNEDYKLHSIKKPSEEGFNYTLRKLKLVYSSF